MIDLFKMGFKSIEFCNEDFESYCTPDHSRSPAGKFNAQLTAVQLRVQQEICLLSRHSEDEAYILDSETGVLLCILRK